MRRFIGVGIGICAVAAFMLVLVQGSLCMKSNTQPCTLDWKIALGIICLVGLAVVLYGLRDKGETEPAPVPPSDGDAVPSAPAG